jgi:hypothetical protein
MGEEAIEQVELLLIRSSILRLLVLLLYCRIPPIGHRHILFLKLLLAEALPANALPELHIVIQAFLEAGD